jgi:hypothetical protein
VFKRICLAALALLAMAFAITRINGDRFRGPVRNALENGLHRKVALGEVRFRLLPLPALTIQNVTIGEDPAIGREPVAYVDTLRAVPRIWPLLFGTLEFSSVTLDDASLNLSRTDREEGGVQWNFASLARATMKDKLPSIHVRGGRVNFKSGDTKSVFYLLDTDIDMWPPDRANGPWTLKVEGQPARTDRRAHGFGSLVARGQWRRDDNTVTIDVRLEKSELSDMLTLFEGRQSGLQGTVQGAAHVAGPLAHAGIAGRLSVAELHGFSNAPPGGRPWVFDLSGAIDLPSQAADLRAVLSGKQPPLDVRYRINRFLERPRWGVTILLADMPMAPVVSLARNFGIDLPDGLGVEGSARGVIGWSAPSGIPQMDGELRMTGVSLSAKDTPPLRIAQADIKFSGSQVTLEPFVIVGDKDENARMRARYDFSDRALIATLASESMSLGAARTAIAVAQVPLLSDATSGVWSGEVGYGPGGWTGDFNIRDADIAFEAFSAPVHVISADATLMGKSMTMRKLNVNVGNIQAVGEYRYEDGADNPHRFRLTVVQADAQDLEKLLQPALRRGSLLNYAFNFGRVPQPDWLRNMRAAGTIQFNSLDLGGAVWTRVRTNVNWNATQVTLTALEGQAATAAIKGEAHIDLSERDPSYELNGTLAGFAWHGGVLSAEGRVTAAGNGKDVLANMRGEGTFRGRFIDLTPLDRYRAIEGNFAWTGRGPRLSINELKLESDAGTLTGEAEMQDNGVVVLKATDGSRQVTASGALMRGEQLKIAQ